VKRPLGKLLESGVRKLRPLLLPKYRQAFAAMVARGMNERREGEEIVCCDFSNPAIDSVGGRYYFSLIRDLIDAGFFPVFIARRATLSSFGTSRIQAMLSKERMGVISSIKDLNEPFFLITDSVAATSPYLKQAVKINYQHRLCENPDEMAFPVFVHPQITVKATLPFVYDINTPRPARVFFGGNTEKGKYDKNIIRDTYHMLSRREMLHEVIATLSPDEIHRPALATEWLASRDHQFFVLCETPHCMTPPERWLEVLAKADFFLAGVGVGMPLCHNLIEALAAGAIPILQYADYLTPPLEDGLNCLAFSDATGLREIIRRIMVMNQDELHLMKTGVRRYYEEFLAPGRFSQRLLADSLAPKVLLMNAYRVPR